MTDRVLNTLIGVFILMTAQAAAILYLMPMHAIHTVPALARFRGRPANVFVTAMGLIAISAIRYGCSDGSDLGGSTAPVVAKPESDNGWRKQTVSGM